MLLLPDFNTKRVSEEKYWVLPPELLEKIKEKLEKEVSNEELEKIREIIKEYITLLLLYLEKKEEFTKDKLLKVIKIIKDENESLHFSSSELEELEEVPSLIESIECDNKSEWDNIIKTSLEKLGSKAINLFEGKEK